MDFLDLTLPAPEENLACDEALLDWAEEHPCCEILRFWEPQIEFVVLGYSNRAAQETNPDACRAAGIPILRRCSGGGTVLQGPGSLNYSLVLSLETRPELASITGANRRVMETHLETIQRLLPGFPLTIQGHTDLTLGTRKFSGNAQRRRRRALLFHGTLLYKFDLERIEQFLPMPSAEPSYRQRRRHSDFVVNIPLSAGTLKKALRETWTAARPFNEIPADAIRKLVQSRYGNAEWNLSR